MKIVVCIKQVPDTSEVKLDPKTNTLIRDGVPSIINPDDKSGIEAALRIKEQVGGTVTVVCMGPPQADVAIREALAMGCDDGVLISGREFGGSDTLATSTIISYAEDIQVESENSIIVKRQYEDRYQKVRIKTPCVITALTELAEPRYMSVSGTVDAYAKEIKVLGFEELKDKLNPEHIGLKGSPTNVVQSFTKQAKGAGTVLKDASADEAVKAIIAKLEEKYII